MQNYLNYINEQIVWQEVPGETALAYTITGCPLRCEGCHSSEYRNAKLGEHLSHAYFAQRLADYRGLISCVLFLGGEWQPELLLPFLKIARAEQLHTCLYSGFESVNSRLLPHLTYLKVGAWDMTRGGLDNPNTNQRFIDLRNQQLLNHKFHKPTQASPQGAIHATT
jgi:anaerobic ribonucleoside-triphosphate reductase activating protein